MAFFMVVSFQKTQAQRVQKEVLERLVEKKRNYNKTQKIGYRIQIYNGNEQKARRIKKTCEILFPEVKIILRYKIPDWKVQTQFFNTRLEADRFLLKIQKEYFSARVF